MKQFSKAQSLLLREAFQDLANKSSCSDINSSTSLKKTFINPDGNAIDINTFLKYFPLPGLHGERLFALFDTNHNGEIDEKEFINGLTTVCLGTFEEKVKFMFKVYDLSNSDTISKEDLRTMLLQIPAHALSFLRNHFHSQNDISANHPSIDLNEDSKPSSIKEDDNISMASIKDHHRGNSGRLKHWQSSGTVRDQERSKDEFENGDPDWQLVTLIVEQAFAECDLDQDGKLSFDQFKHWVKQNKEILLFMESVFPTVSTPPNSNSTAESRVAHLPLNRASDLAMDIATSEGNPKLLLNNQSNEKRFGDDFDEGVFLTEDIISQIWQDTDSRASTPHLPPAFMLLRAATPRVVPNQVNFTKLLRTTSEGKSRINADHIESEYVTIVGESFQDRDTRLSVLDSESGQDQEDASNASAMAERRVQSKGRRFSDPFGKKRFNNDQSSNSPAPYSPSLASSIPSNAAATDMSQGETSSPYTSARESTPMQYPLSDSAPRLQRESNMSTSRPRVYMGTLFKFGKRFNQLVARWYVIHEDDDILYHYKNRYDEFPSGVTFLDGCFIRPTGDIGSDGQKDQNGSSSVSSVASRSASMFSLSSCRLSSFQSSDDDNSGENDSLSKSHTIQKERAKRDSHDNSTPPTAPGTKRSFQQVSNGNLFGIEIIASGSHKNSRQILYARTLKARNEWVAALRRAANVVSFEASYRLLNQIGTGKYCKVFKCSKKKDDTIYAVKVIDKTVLLPIDKELLRSEIAIMKMVKHPHILQLENSFETPERTYIVTPFIQGGDLFDLVTKPGSPYQVPLHEDDIHTVAKPLIHAVRYLHSLGVAHRDLKPENVLVGNMLSDIKICDFGVSAVASASTEMNLPCGTLAYAAPEVLRGKYGREADMWSIGVIIYFLCCGVLPFNGQSDRDTAERIIALEPQFLHYAFKDKSKDLLGFIRRLLTKNRKIRLSAEEAVTHPWFDTYKGLRQRIRSESDLSAKATSPRQSNADEKQNDVQAEQPSTENISSTLLKPQLQTVIEEDANDLKYASKDSGSDSARASTENDLKGKEFIEKKVDAPTKKESIEEGEEEKI